MILIINVVVNNPLVMLNVVKYLLTN